MFTDPYKVDFPKSEEAIQDLSIAKHFTIFDNDNVYRPDPIEITELAEAVGAPNISSVVSYRPQRRVFHWEMAYINVYSKIRNFEEFKTLVTKFHKEVIPFLTVIVEAVENERQLIQKNVYNAYQNIKNGAPSNDPIFHETYDVYQCIKARIDNGLYDLGAIKKDETLESVVIKVASDRIYNYSPVIDLLLREFVINHFYRLKSLLEISPIKFSKTGNRIIIIAAPTGSGKSTLAGQIASFYSEAGIANFSSGNYRPLLKTDTAEAVLSMGSTFALSLEETRAVYYIAKRLIMENLSKKEIQGFPAALIELTTQNHVEFANNVLSQTTVDFPGYVCFVHLPVEKAIYRAFNRCANPTKSSDHNKYVTRKDFISNHKFFGTFIEDLIKKLTTAYFVLEVRSNNVSKGDELQLIATGNSAKNEFNIFDFDQMVELLKKRFLNEKALSEKELYPTFTDYHNNKIKSALEGLSYHIKLNFIDQKSGNIYAGIKNGELQIINTKLALSFCSNPIIKLWYNQD